MRGFQMPRTNQELPLYHNSDGTKTLVKNPKRYKFLVVNIITFWQLFVELFVLSKTMWDRKPVINTFYTHNLCNNIILILSH